MARLLEEDTLPLTPEEPYVLPSFRLCIDTGTLEELRRKRQRMLFESIPFAFPTHIIFRASSGIALDASLRRFAVKEP